MIQFQEQTTEEKYEMYRKCSKDELIGMLIEANKQLDRLISGLNSEERCDVCGGAPNVIVKTRAGKFCNEHVKF